MLPIEGEPLYTGWTSAVDQGEPSSSALAGSWPRQRTADQRPWLTSQMQDRCAPNDRVTLFTSHDGKLQSVS